MSDPKSENGAMSDKEAVSAMKKADMADKAKAEKAKVIDAEPAKPQPTTRGFSLRTKLIGILVILVIVAGALAAALYPLWRDNAQQLVANSGLPLTVPAVPDNDFYRTVESVNGFFGGAETASEAAPAPVATPAAEPVVDPVAAMADRLSTLEADLESLRADVRAAQSSADDAAAKVNTLSEDLNARPAGDTDALAARVEALERRMDQLAMQPAGTTTTDSTASANVNAALLNTLGALRERIVALESKQTVDPAELESTKKASAERIASLEKELASVRQLAEQRAPERERAGLLLLAVGQLEAATATSGSFAGQIASVADLAGSDAPAVENALGTLQSHKDGVETKISLAERFETVAKAVSQAKIAGSDEGFVGKTLNNLASLVTVRRTDVTDGPGVDAILARAEKALDHGDLAGAVEAMKQLDGAPAERAADWLKSAEARLAVDGAVADLRGAALASIAKAG